MASADFDQNAEPVSPTYPGATSTSYTVHGGDTLQSIARGLWGDAALITAADNVASQGINMVIGQQKQFSWTSLAVSAISAPIARAVGGELTGEGGVFAKSDPAVQALVKSTTSALVSAVTHLAIQGGKLQWEAIAADALSGAVRGYYDSQNQTTAATPPKDEATREEVVVRLGGVGNAANAANTKDSAQNLSSGAQEIFDGLVNAFGSIQQQKPELSQRPRYEQTADLDNRFGVTVTDYPGQIRIPLDGKMPAGRSDVLKIEGAVVDDPSIVEIVLPGTNTPSRKTSSPPHPKQRHPSSASLATVCELHRTLFPELILVPLGRSTAQASSRCFLPGMTSPREQSAALGKWPNKG